LENDALVLLEWEDSRRPLLEKRLESFYSSGEITGKPLEFTLLHGVEGYKARRVLLAGAGKRDKFDRNALRHLAGAAVRFLKSKSIRTIAIALEDGSSDPESVTAATEGAILGAWEPGHLKTDKEGEKPVDSLVIAVDSSDRALEAAFEK